MPHKPKGYIKVILPNDFNEVSFSKFSKENEARAAGYRGIADIDFPQKSNDPQAEVVFEIVISEVENNKANLNVYAYKDNGGNPWEPLDSKKDVDADGDYIIRAIMKVGDPPIAVG